MFVCRYFVLYEYGGIYADCDVECLKPLEGYLSGRNIVLPREPDIHNLFHNKLKSEKLVSNAIMASQPRHPFFKYIIDTLGNRVVKSETFGIKIMETTGPLMMVDAYKEYSSNHDDPLPLDDAELFLPIGDPILRDNFKKFCNDLKSKGIKNMALAEKICVPYLRDQGDNITEKSLTVHHWAHSWVPSFKAGLNKYTKFHINDLRKPKIQFK